MEAAPGFEPGNNGFADRRLSHLAMPPSYCAALDSTSEGSALATVLATVEILSASARTRSSEIRPYRSVVRTVE